jgi:hypothetical protein
MDMGNGRTLVISSIDSERDPAKAHASHGNIINLSLGLFKGALGVSSHLGL